MRSVFVLNNADPLTSCCGPTTKSCRNFWYINTLDTNTSIWSTDIEPKSIHQHASKTDTECEYLEIKSARILENAYERMRSFSPRTHTGSVPCAHKVAWFARRTYFKYYRIYSGFEQRHIYVFFDGFRGSFLNTFVCIFF